MVPPGDERPPSTRRGADELACASRVRTSPSGAVHEGLFMEGQIAIVAPGHSVIHRRCE
ncbi:hypothetical protein HMPREF0682_0424 [Propionibacterium acidifaciens F0233]|uniref:Uncharacterized protein n=1 Tax=Propionibacterium acidifaciens F0233 TaxID=553198 RepID=U2S5I8_9ACTN|nr:hypothetical protein HMPREF0682_0424 [Propionibacterium acidifaciens F0233]